MKDPTRGGTAVTVNEIASKSGVEIVLDETTIPVRPEVRSLCNILGLNPLHMSCEGTIIMAVDSESTDDILSALAKNQATTEAQVIGSVSSGNARVLMRTAIGGKKIVQVPYGEPVPRVC